MGPISPDPDCFGMPRAYDPIVVAVLGARLQVVTLRGCVLLRRIGRVSLHVQYLLLLLRLLPFLCLG